MPLTTTNHYIGLLLIPTIVYSKMQKGGYEERKHGPVLMVKQRNKRRGEMQFVFDYLSIFNEGMSYIKVI